MRGKEAQITVASLEGGKYGAHYKKTISTNQQVKALRFCSGLTAKVASNSKQRTVQLDLQPNI